MFWCAWTLLLVVVPLTVDAAVGNLHFLHGWQLPFYAVMLPLNYLGFRIHWPIALNYWHNGYTDE